MTLENLDNDNFWDSCLEQELCGAEADKRELLFFLHGLTSLIRGFCDHLDLEARGVLGKEEMAVSHTSLNCVQMNKLLVSTSGQVNSSTSSRQAYCG